MFAVPPIPKERAEAMLSRRRPSSVFRRAANPAALRRVELLYIPYYVVELVVARGSDSLRTSIAIDGLMGNAVFFAADDLRFEPGGFAAACEHVLSPDRARALAVEKYRWQVIEHSLRTKRTSRIDRIVDVKKIFYPFWVGYFKKGKSYDFKALDGISGEVQGVNVRKILLSAFRRMKMLCPD